MLTLLGAVALSAACAAVAVLRLRGFRRLTASSARGAEPDGDDELEQRLLARERELFWSLSRRNLKALSRVALAGGTGFGVFELTGGASRLPLAAACFVAGVAGWAACQEALRRFGSSAGTHSESASAGALRRGSTRSGPGSWD